VAVEEAYEPPEVVVIGSVQDLTQGTVFAPGQDSLSAIPTPGDTYGS
jgi:hypothetical protein